MSMGASITTRTTKNGRRFVVRYRLGGRAYPVQHGGSFHTLKEARQRRDLLAGEIAAGRDPQILLDALRAPSTPSRTFLVVAEEYQTTRVDLAAHTTKKAKSHLAALKPFFGSMSPSAITPADVQEWISTSKLRPSSIRRYMDTRDPRLCRCRPEPGAEQARSATARGACHPRAAERCAGGSDHRSVQAAVAARGANACRDGDAGR
jgi:hypothetical protein